MYPARLASNQALHISGAFSLNQEQRHFCPLLAICPKLGCELKIRLWTSQRAFSGQWQALALAFCDTCFNWRHWSSLHPHSLNWTNKFCNVDKHISNCYSIGSEQKAKDKQRNTASFWQYECVVAIPFIKRYAGGLLGGWWASFHHVYISHRSVWSQFHLSSIGPLHCISGFKIVFLRPEDKITLSYYIYCIYHIYCINYCWAGLVICYNLLSLLQPTASFHLGAACNYIRRFSEYKFKNKYKHTTTFVISHFFIIFEYPYVWIISTK